MKGFLYLCIFSCFFLFLTACNDKNNEQLLKERITQLEKELEDANKNESNKPRTSKPQVNVKPEIILLDPNTEDVVYSFDPKTLGYGTDLEQYTNQIKEIAKTLAQGNNETEGYDQKMIPDRIDENGQIAKGTPRVILKESELVNKILELSPNGGEIQLPIFTYESGYNPEEVSSLQEEVIASFTTYFDPNVEGRSHNIKQSAKVISNIIIGDGDYFSFNTTVGPRTEETGYQPALEIVNNEYVMGIGGGICQTSSTLYNAVDQIDVHYIEKHHHSLSVGYVPNGRDATVSYGTLDFRFQNTLGFPFIIKATTTTNSLTVEIWTSKVHSQKL